MKQTVFPNCGNAPKMGAVVDLMIALADRDANAVQHLTREDFVYQAVGRDDHMDYEALASELPKRPAVSSITVDNGMSHGNGAMCEGTLEFADSDTLRFCAVAKFTSTARDALIKQLHVYYV